MKVIVAGSRHINDFSVVSDAVKASGFCITEVVSGGAVGVDFCGEQWAASHNVFLTIFQADWGKYGRSAGPRRNRDMAEYADALVAVWDGESRGTLNMIERMVSLGKSVYLHIIPQEE